MFFRKIYNFGDKLEDKVRGKLSRYPIIYAFLGGAGIIIFWRGVWHTADYIMKALFTVSDNVSSTGASQLPWWDGPLSILIGSIFLLTIGLFISSFIGNEIIISGLKKEKKIVEKTGEEVGVELEEEKKIRREIHDMDGRLKRIEEILKKA